MTDQGKDAREFAFSAAVAGFCFLGIAVLLLAAWIFNGWDR